MLRSLYSGVSGMRSNQTKMDVLGNNIANSSTTGFKAGRVRFQDMLSQTVANAQSPTAGNLGGVNAQQIGLGVKVGSIDTIMTGGVMQATNRNLDFAIEGEGFFVLSQGGEAGTKLYSRDGAFYRDYQGNLVNSGGYRTMGYSPEYTKLTSALTEAEVVLTEAEAKVAATEAAAKAAEDAAAVTGADPSLVGIATALRTKANEAVTAKDLAATASTDAKAAVVKANEDGLDKNLVLLNIPNKIMGVDGTEVEMESYAIDGTGTIKGVYSDGKIYDLGQIAVTKFANPEGLEKLGNSNYRASNNSGIPENGRASANGYGIIRSGVLEMSNVDLANEFTELIVTSRSYQANSRTITTSDEMLQELINLKR